MRKIHDIVPNRRRFKKAMLHLRLNFWARGFISCVRQDVDLQKELADWPDGFTFLLQVLPDKPYIGLRKDANGLHIIKTPHDVNNKVFVNKNKSSYLSSCETVMAFKNFVIAWDVFSGRIAMRQAFTENRFDLNGNIAYGSSVVRSMILTQNILFPRLIDHGSLRLGHKRRVSRLKIYTKSMLMRNKRTEGSSNDSEILRVFE